MISPSELVKLIVTNNPGAVRRNLLQSGLVGQNFQLTSDGFMQLLSELPEQIVQTREQAIVFITEILNVNIDPQGVGGNQLLQLSQNTGLPLKSIVQQIFEQNMPPMLPSNTPKQQSTCGCHSKPKIEGKQAFILVLAVLGLLFLITRLERLIAKWIEIPVLQFQMLHQ